MIERKLVIKNKLGLHARPAARLVEITARYDADIFLKRGDLEVNGKSIMGILMLAAERGTEITIRSEGKDEEDMTQAVTDLLEGKFDEE